MWILCELVTCYYSRPTTILIFKKKKNSSINQCSHQIYNALKTQLLAILILLLAYVKCPLNNPKKYFCNASAILPSHIKGLLCWMRLCYADVIVKGKLCQYLLQLSCYGERAGPDGTNHGLCLVAWRTSGRNWWLWHSQGFVIIYILYYTHMHNVGTFVMPVILLFPVLKIFCVEYVYDMGTSS